MSVSPPDPVTTHHKDVPAGKAFEDEGQDHTRNPIPHSLQVERCPERPAPATSIHHTTPLAAWLPSSWSAVGRFLAPSLPPGIGDALHSTALAPIALAIGRRPRARWPPSPARPGSAVPAQTGG
jgi:hypothetical protein